MTSLSWKTHEIYDERDFGEFLRLVIQTGDLFCGLHGIVNLQLELLKIIDKFVLAFVVASENKKVDTMPSWNGNALPLRVIWERESTDEFLSQMANYAKLWFCAVSMLTKLLNKELACRWFETP